MEKIRLTQGQNLSSKRKFYACPSCERELDELRSFPRVFIKAVDLYSPEDYPAAISQHREDLLAYNKAKWNRPLVPAEVLEYFDKNPDVDEFTHIDDYIYERPDAKKKDYPAVLETELETEERQVDFLWHRRFNWINVIKNTVENNLSLKKYLDSLGELVGSEVRTKKLFPQWKLYQLPGFHRREAGYKVPKSDNLILDLLDNRSRDAGHMSANIAMATPGPNFGSAGGATVRILMDIGNISYEGRLNSQV